MNTQAPTTPVRSSIVVGASVDTAFEVFTTDMASWWPASHHVLEAELDTTVFEPRVGGHIIDRGVDGSECAWATIRAYESPELLVFSWDLGLDWQVETDPDRVSEVEVRFIAEGPGRTRVEVEHRHIERHGQGWEQMRAAVDSEGGWDAVLAALGQRLPA